MVIEIDFNQNIPASELYNANKFFLNKSIITALRMGGNDNFNGVTCRIPTTQFLNNNSIKGLTFDVTNQTEFRLNLILTNVEK